jgi:hypothetical protein
VPDRVLPSYNPLRLVAVVIGDVFMDTDIRRLWQSLDRRLAPDANLREDRQHVQDFLRRAQSKAGGRESLGAIHFYPPGEGRKYIPGGHEIRMPVGVERVGLLLYQFAPGMVWGANTMSSSSRSHREPTPGL